MRADWVAGSVRARALVRRCMGSGRARRLAASQSLDEALETLAGTAYGRDVAPGQTLSGAQHAVAASCLWHLRVLAGWLPRPGVRILRAATCWFEIANVDGLIQRMDGQRPEQPFTLGALATTGPRLWQAGTPAELRVELAASPWGDPGAEDARSIRLSMRFAAAARLGATAPQITPWAAGAAAVLVAGERFGAGGPLPEAAAEQAMALVGPAALAAGSLPEMIASLPRSAAWALAGIDDPGALWPAEVRCWARLEHDGQRLLSTWGYSEVPVIGAVAVLAADCRRVRSALELAARGGGPLEAYDAVA